MIKHLVGLTVSMRVPEMELMAPPATVATLPVSWLESICTTAAGREGPLLVLKVFMPKLMAPPDCRCGSIFKYSSGGSHVDRSLHTFLTENQINLRMFQNA